ncbi:putative lipase serine [Phaeomoniella chlamydospora]|uniref:Putative lipase serine n=1 Tax=Phaeomoniella chlamydospora TaxID=158046 RepID=A0A0G2GY74_PHACM|nr:putative lipase serine [Phaeomoniella chlamydospora]
MLTKIVQIMGLVQLKCNPDHLKYLSETLQNHYGKDKLVTLNCKSNAGNFTYDGIDVGAERAVKEIRAFSKKLNEDGQPITKFSIVGYSLGGLLARYVIGCLDHDGFFQSIKPVNFTTFATPHLGTRTPLTLWTSHVFNTFGPKIVSASGQQLFVMDEFRDTKMPLLEIMTDPDSIFMRALAKFEVKTIYANILNDRLAHFYTTAISASDPYAEADLNKLKYNYVEGFEPIVIDGRNPCEPLKEGETPIHTPTYLETIGSSARKVATVCAIAIAAPIFATGLMATSAIETYRSQRRIRLHSNSEEALRLPNVIKKVASDLEDKVETIANSSPITDLTMPTMQQQDIATPNSSSSSSPDTSSTTLPASHTKQPPTTTTTTTQDSQEDDLEILERQLSHLPTPQLALLPSQFRMISHLDKIGLQKFHIYIHNTNWTHAAIVVRQPWRSAFGEGKTVVRHWIERQFVV